ncbi:PEP-CTERM/exosortase system-associated acyltransferase [Colwellia sp. E2M01]|uniref:PEP-CTERM/exosortase system-associated acyltransferase n=1 Tax=Colwellia sp. E2M01 TaxID=2841561 RepID=UPI00209006E8|nr:PEP-CTERM/exosortase system-associated acyltransferase [Colwellia sp. E2M01]
MTAKKNKIKQNAPPNNGAKLAPQKQESIADHFTQFLQARIAVNDKLKDEVFQIRHNVYCEELGFEKATKDERETDEFDQRSIFTLIQHKKSKVFTSCVRLVTSNNTDELLPIETFCASSITKSDYSPDNFDRKEIGEISRLAVKSDFRRRKADNFKGCATGAISEHNYSETELRCFPFIAIGLYISAAIMCTKQNIKHAYVMMEPRLARSMKFVGINFQQIGASVNYHGLRAPYYIKPADFTKQLSPEFKTLYNTIEKDIIEQLAESS